MNINKKGALKGSFFYATYSYQIQKFCSLTSISIYAACPETTRRRLTDWSWLLKYEVPPTTALEVKARLSICSADPVEDLLS